MWVVSHVSAIASAGPAKQLHAVSHPEGTSVLETNSFDSENMSLPLELTQTAATSKLLGPQVPSNILRWLTTATWCKAAVVDMFGLSVDLGCQ